MQRESGSVSLAKMALDEKMVHFVVQRTSCGHPKAPPECSYRAYQSTLPSEYGSTIQDDGIF